MRPTSDDVVAIVIGSGDDRRWHFKSSYGDTHTEATALTFGEAVVKVARFARRLNVGGYVETVAGKTWYTVTAIAESAPPPPTLPIWQTSKRAQRKKARKAAKAAARV